MKTYVISSAIIKKQATLLIVKRSPAARFAPGEWEFVSGFIKEHEAAEDTILREVTEELSCNGRIVRPLPIYEQTDADGKWVIVPFEVEIGDGPIVLSTEHTEYKWVTKQEILQLPELSSDIDRLTL